MVGEMPSKGRMRMRLLKVQAGSAVDCTIVGSELATLRLHWIGKRSFVCPGGDCAACMEGGSRWAGFLPVLVTMGPGSPKGVCLLEVTENAWMRFDGLCRMESEADLFGLRISVCRRRAKEPLCIDPLGRDDVGERKPLDVRVCYDALATLYTLPSLNPVETIGDWVERASVAAGHQIAVALLRDRG